MEQEERLANISEYWAKRASTHLVALNNDVYAARLAGVDLGEVTPEIVERLMLEAMTLADIDPGKGGDHSLAIRRKKAGMPETIGGPAIVVTEPELEGELVYESEPEEF